MPEMADYIKNNITKDVVLEFFNDRIVNNNQTLSVHVLGAANDTPLTQETLKTYIQDLSANKSDENTGGNAGENVGENAGENVGENKNTENTGDEDKTAMESYLKHISGYKEYRTLSDIRDMKKSCYLYPAQVPNERDEELLFSRLI